MNLQHAAKSLILLASPIIVGQLGQMLVTAGDVYVASLYSTKSVAAIGVASGVINPFYLFGMGLMMGVSPSLAIRRGSGVDKREDLSSILVYSAIWGVLICVTTLLANLAVPYFGFQPELVPSIQLYINIVSWSLPFGIIFQGVREYLQAYEDVFYANLISILAVLFNLVVNYVLVFGGLGIEAMGEVGLAWASFITRVVQCLILLIYALRHEVLNKVSMKLGSNIFKFSLPIAIMFFFEVLAFCSVSLLSGKISVIAAATNNLVLTFASILFMVPLSIASAVAVKIGNAFGRHDFQEIKLFTNSAFFLVFIFVCCTSLLLFGLPSEIMGIMTKDPEVTNLGIKILFIVAIFQLFDSLQVVLSGILRGLKQTKMPSLLVFIGYWIFGIPSGYYLTFQADYGAVGLWIGLAISLSLVSLFLGFIVYRNIYSSKINIRRTL